MISNPYHNLVFSCNDILSLRGAVVQLNDDERRQIETSNGLKREPIGTARKLWLG